MKTILMTLISGFISCLASAQTAPIVLPFQQETLKAEVKWDSPAPVTGLENKMQIQWRNQAGEPVEIPGDFRVVLFMPDMGHGSSPTKIAKLTEPGLYRVSKIHFTMPGLWEVRITLRLPDVEPETQMFSLVAPDFAP